MDNTSKNLSPINNISVVDHVVERITSAIIGGELKPGSKIPTENELCKIFDVGRNSIREAVKMLVACGILEIRRADGTYVAEKSSDRIINPAIYWLILEGSSNDIMELRKCIENGTLEILVRKICPEDIEKLKDNIRQMKELVETAPQDYMSFARLDLDFHKICFEATRNPLIVKIGNLMLRMTEGSLVKTALKNSQSNTLPNIMANHQMLADIIEGKDSSKIVDALETSYTIWSKSFSAE